MEVWKDIPGYNGLYQASDQGRIKSLPKAWVVRNGGLHTTTERILKQNNSCHGYCAVSLRKNNITSRVLVHRIIMLTFFGKSKLQVNHIDGVKDNNKLANLEYCTCSENHKHAFKIGLYSKKGESHHMAKLTEQQVLEIRSLSGKVKQGHWNQLAKSLNVHRNTLYAARVKKNWGCVS